MIQKRALYMCIHAEVKAFARNKKKKEVTSENDINVGRLCMNSRRCVLVFFVCFFFLSMFSHSAVAASVLPVVGKLHAAMMMCIYMSVSIYIYRYVLPMWKQYSRLQATTFQRSPDPLSHDLDSLDIQRLKSRSLNGEESARPHARVNAHTCAHHQTALLSIYLELYYI